MTDDPKKEDSSNDITNVFGKNGKWQKITFLISSVISIFSAWNNLVVAFFAPNINYWCADHPNGTEETNRTSPGEHQCEFMGPDNKSKIPCTEMEYDHSFYRSTIIEEWDLVCENEWLISVSQSVYMAGYMTSMLVFGQLSDRFGRRPIFFTALGILLVSNVACLFANHFIVFTILRFFISLGVSGAGATSFVILMETVGPEFRSAYGLGYNFGWALGYILLPGIAWWLRDWFYIQMAITIPCFVLVASWWFISESPRWLLTNNRFDKAEKVVTTAAKKNNKNLMEAKNAFKQIRNNLEKAEAPKKTQATIFSLLRTPNMRKKTLNLYFCWFVNSFIYFGLSLNTNDLGGNPFINFFIAGAIEFPAYVVSIFVIRIFGRRIPQMATMVIGGMACVLTIPIGDDLLWLKISLAMIGKFCITASFGIVYVFSAEIYPTVVRNVGVGSSSTCARIGSMVAPFVKELGKATKPEVPYAVYGGLSVVSGLLVLLLPETHQCSLPDTIQEGEQFGTKAYNPIKGINTEISMVEKEVLDQNDKTRL
ncbi:organic cation transporter protein-like [Centruroides sculpturatus]|uniref:organic cation transporter protein-like n=1 Tax=Centruroides sculpturatus TaxID=218467 RepID=UPI000C6E6E07|nr:organic cation transporter protein-like [Centruroides sculpturatus]XP_023218038.1 organic cation transporter protein-like [Centruroides sculpturatus]